MGEDKLSLEKLKLGRVCVLAEIEHLRHPQCFYAEGTCAKCVLSCCACRKGGKGFILCFCFLHIWLLGVCVNPTLRKRISGCLVLTVEEMDPSRKTEIWAGGGDTHLEISVLRRVELGLWWVQSQPWIHSHPKSSHWDSVKFCLAEWQQNKYLILESLGTISLFRTKLHKPSALPIFCHCGTSSGPPKLWGEAFIQHTVPQDVKSTGVRKAISRS